MFQAVQYVKETRGHLGRCSQVSERRSSQKPLSPAERNERGLERAENVEGMTVASVRRSAGAGAPVVADLWRTQGRLIGRLCPWPGADGGSERRDVRDRAVPPPRFRLALRPSLAAS